MYHLRRVLLWSFCLLPASGIPQELALREESALDSLLAIPISTAAKYAQSASRAPASVTLITAEDLARYGYIGLYILLYMIDDVVIFAIAIYTLHATGLTTKYRRFTLIFGGALMYALGILMIFWPEALTFS